MSYGISSQNQYYYYNPRKEVQFTALKAGLVGGAIIGGTDIGLQYLVKNNKGKIIEKTTEEVAKNKKIKIFSKLAERYNTALLFDKINWKKAGKTALFGGAIVGLIGAFNSAYKKLPKGNIYG